MLNIHTHTQLNKYVVLDEMNNCGKNYVFKAYIQSDDDNDINSSSKKLFIIKAIPYGTEEEIQIYDNESEILHIFNNMSTVIKYVETFVMKNELTCGKQYIFAVMDYCSCTDLNDFFVKHSNDNIIQDQIRSIAFQSLTILKVIHNQNIIHHDIKPENFLVESITPLKLKITDFEFSVKLPENGTASKPSGTVFYMAPELLDCLPHNQSVDIWALGIMLYELAAKKMPFNLKKDQPQRHIIRLKIKRNSLTFDVDSFHDYIFTDLLTKMLEKDSSLRITAEEALNHPYFQYNSSNCQFSYN